MSDTNFKQNTLPRFPERGSWRPLDFCFRGWGKSKWIGLGDDVVGDVFRARGVVAELLGELAAAAISQNHRKFRFLIQRLTSAVTTSAMASKGIALFPEIRTFRGAVSVRSIPESGK